MNATLEAVIIIPTRDQAGSLDRCLSALCADSSQVPREIVVVDNGSSDHTADVVSSHASATPSRVRRVWEPKPGASLARNVGIARSAAPLILFVDDDVTVHDGWADALANALSVPGVVAAGGRILPAWSGAVPQWLLDGPQRTNAALDDYGALSFRCASDRLPFGANLGFRRTALAPFRQPFDERLGHRGRVAMGSEDWHLLKQLLRTGEVRYEAGAVVDHHVSASRMNYETIRRRMWQLGFGLARSERLLDRPQPAWPRAAVRTVRVAREAARQRHQKVAVDAPNSGEAAWADFYAHFWWGFHTETLTGRVPRLADLLAERLLGRG
jgi:glycosyltransferase involved in cell wall biosynthesis